MFAGYQFDVRRAMKPDQISGIAVRAEVGRTERLACASWAGDLVNRRRRRQVLSASSQSTQTRLSLRPNTLKQRPWF
jgi:hypothetical protein